MKIKHRTFGFEVKSLEKDGSFSGYGSVFGVTDSYRDVVMPGAFGKTLAAWKAKNALPPLLWQHQSYSPIGKYTSMVEDGKGLYTEGQLLINDVQQAKEAYALLKVDAIRGQSIGYVPDESEYDMDTNVNKLTEIDLWECSIVTFPANIEAGVTAIKSALADGMTIREFEELARDAMGLSRKQATALASGGFAALMKHRDDAKGAVDEGLIDKLAKGIENFKF